MVYAAVGVSGSQNGDNFRVIDQLFIRPIKHHRCQSMLGSLSNDDADGNENCKKSNRFD